MDPVDDIDNYKFGIFYFNRDDPRTIVPKRVRFLGYTLNFARPTSYLILFTTLAVVMFLSRF